MTTNATPARSAGSPTGCGKWAGTGSADHWRHVLVGLLENLGKGAYSPAGYRGLINYYIKESHSPAVWKVVMGLMASHAAVAAPTQAMTEISLGVLLVIGLVTRPAAFVAFGLQASLWVSELATAWICELLVPVLASLGLAVGRGGRAWGVDACLAERWPSSPGW
jgi:hypothetical protein